MHHSLTLEPRPTGCPVPLTAIQKWYWDVKLKGGTQRSALRLCAASLRLSGPLDTSRLEESIERVQHRHASLRTRVMKVDRSPTQIVDPPQRFHLQIEDLSPMTPKERENIARQLGSEFFTERIDLAREPMLAARLLKLSDLEHILIVGTDHMISDGTSCSILSHELLTVYRRIASSSLPDLKLQFPDFAVWQHTTNDAWLKDHAPYWRGRLSGAPQVLIPPDHGAKADSPNTSEWHYAPFGKKITQALHEIARRERAMIALVVLSLYLILISKWCEQSDLLVELISHGRYGHPELKHMIGPLAYPMHLRVEVGSNFSLRDVVQQVTAEFSSALRHDASRVLGTIVTGFPTQLYFNWLPADSATCPEDSAPDASDSVKIRPFPVAKDEPTVFSPFFKDTPSGLVTIVRYHRELYDKRTLERFGNELRWLAQQCALDPRMQLHNLRF